MKLDHLQSGHIKTGSGFTQGGYCRSMTVHRFSFICISTYIDLAFLLGMISLDITFLRRYLVKVPEGYPLEKAGPVFCAGE